MPSPHKNADNEYFVHTEPNVVKTDGWDFFGTSKESAAELKVKELEKELNECKVNYTNLNSRYDQLQVQYKNYADTMKEVADELKCFKVHDYFLQKYVSKEQKQTIQLEKETWHKTLKDYFSNNDESWMSIHKTSLKHMTDELNNYNQTRHDDYYDRRIMTYTDFIKQRQILS